MGVFYIEIKVRGEGEYSERSEALNALVDSGALHSMIPRPLLEHLGVTVEFEQLYELADGSKLKFDVGFVKFEIHGEERRCLALFGPDSEDSAVLGATSLETFSLAVDPVNQTLVESIPKARPV